MNELMVDDRPGVKKDALRGRPELRRVVRAVFGNDDDPVELLRERAQHLLPDRRVIVWEADPLTFTFTYVSPEAEALLGYSPLRWQEKDFWTTKVVHPEDARDAISHCAMATAAGLDHDFEYRACAADGRIMRVHDVVHVLKGPLGFAACLRGLMISGGADGSAPSADTIA